MIVEPCKSSVNGRDRLDIPRFLGTGHNDDRQAQGTRRRNLRVSRTTSGILGDQNVDALAFHQRALSRFIERRTVENGNHVRNRQNVADRFDGADQISMLWSLREGMKLKAPDREEYAAGYLSKSTDGSIHGRNIDPAIAILPRPGRTSQGEERGAGYRAGSRSIVRHDGGKGMRRIDDSFDALVLQEANESLNAAETAGAGWDGQGSGIVGATGHGQQRTELGPACQPIRERGSLGGAAQNENAHEPLFLEF